MGNSPIYQSNRGHADNALGDADAFSIWSPTAGSLWSFSTSSHPTQGQPGGALVAGSTALDHLLSLATGPMVPNLRAETELVPLGQDAVLPAGWCSCGVGECQCSPSSWRSSG